MDDLKDRLRKGCVFWGEFDPQIHEGETDALMSEAAARIEALEGQLAAVTASARANMEEKHKERAEAKLWFGKAQEWKAQLAAREAEIAAWLRGSKDASWLANTHPACLNELADAIEAGEYRSNPQ